MRVVNKRSANLTANNNFKAKQTPVQSQASTKQATNSDETNLNSVDDEEENGEENEDEEEVSDHSEDKQKSNAYGY
jgi:hypothetical protein